MDVAAFIDKYSPVVEHLARVAEQIPAEKSMFKPSENSLPWIYLLSHLPSHWIIFMKLLDGEPDHGFPGLYRAEMPQEPSGLPSRYRDRWVVFADYLRGKPESFVETTFSPPWSGLDIPGCPDFPGVPDETVGALLDWLLEEGYHHRGQAWVYARMNGVKPPGIWGL